MKVIKKLFVLFIVSVFMISMAVTTASAVSVAKNEKNTAIVIDSKSKTVNYKITWNANNGKIGTKNTLTTTVKKGSKIKNMPNTPKRSDYTFKGWYTKKTGGTKISANTKPSKSVTYFAQWNLKLVGTWKDSSNTFIFNKNGKFKYLNYTGSKSSCTEGNYKVVGGKIQLTKIVFEPGKTAQKQRENTVFEYKFVKDSGGEYLLIPTVFNDMAYVDISYGTGLRKA
jgi:uncharacterized repeat protein (TIGR02543 family)